VCVCVCVRVCVCVCEREREREPSFDTRAVWAIPQEAVAISPQLSHPSTHVPPAAAPAPTLPPPHHSFLKPSSFVGTCLSCVSPVKKTTRTTERSVSTHSLQAQTHITPGQERKNDFREFVAEPKLSILSPAPHPHHAASRNSHRMTCAA